VIPLRRLRVSAISFLNTAPLMWDFTHPPLDAELALRYDTHFTLPNLCAAELAAGSADIGLIPVAAYATTPDLAILPGPAIASLDHVRSILLLTRRGLALEDIESIALDSTSRTSAALVRVIFSKFIGTNPTYSTHAPDVATMLATSDAALLIGDPALLARQADTCGDYACHDLAAFWRARTGLPFVFAFWAMRSSAPAETGLAAAEIIRDFQHSRDQGLAHLDELVTEWKHRIALPAETIRTYWTENIHYALDAECVDGLELFFRYAAECSALPPAPALRILRSWPEAF
jgi:chorismate dehydratase